MIHHKIAIVVSQFNQDISDNLLEGAINCYESNEGNIDNIDIFKVPGAFEIPGVVKNLINKDSYKAIICFGSIIKGETAHFEYISSSVTDSLSFLSISDNTKIPILYGVLTTYNYNQALVRSRMDKKNKGGEAAKAVLSVLGI